MRFFQYATSTTSITLTYPGGFWSFSFASKGLHPIRDFNEQKVQESGMDFNTIIPKSIVRHL